MAIYTEVGGSSALDTKIEEVVADAVGGDAAAVRPEQGVVSVGKGAKRSTRRAVPGGRPPAEVNTGVQDIGLNGLYRVISKGRSRIVINIRPPGRPPGGLMVHPHISRVAGRQCRCRSRRNTIALPPHH